MKIWKKLENEFYGGKIMRNEKIYDNQEKDIRERVFIGNGTQITVLTQKNSIIGIIQDNIAILSCECKNTVSPECDIFYITNFDKIICNHVCIEGEVLEFDNTALQDLIHFLYEAENERIRFERLISIKKLNEVIDNCVSVSETNTLLNQYLYKTSIFADKLGNIVHELVVFDKTSNCECISTKYTVANQFFKADLC